MKTEDYNKKRASVKRATTVTHTIIEAEKPSESARRIFKRKPYYLTVSGR